MGEEQDALAALAGRRITVSDIARILEVTRKTAHKRLADGLNASDVIRICRAIDVNPVEALVEMKFVTLAEAMDFVDSDGELLATADQQSLFLELADRMLTTTQLADMIAARARAGEPITGGPGDSPKVFEAKGLALSRAGFMGTEATPDDLEALRKKRNQTGMSDLPDSVAAHIDDEKGVPDIPSEAEESQDPGEENFDPA